MAIAAAALASLAARLRTPPDALYTVATVALFPAAYLLLALAYGADIHWWFVAVLPLTGLAFRALGDDDHPRRR